MSRQGPLAGVQVLEVGGIGPGPFGVMLLADLGAEVVRVDRVDDVANEMTPVLALGLLLRSRRSVGLDLKAPEGVDLLLQLAERSDVLVEGFRPGVAERLGFGPDVCLERNPRLVYARMTGWGQEGPLAERAGHDLNYASVGGAIHPIGRKDSPPPPPLNIIADFGGGGAYLAMGVAAALWEREQSGRGQVVDVAMVDGVASLTTMFQGMLAKGLWSTERESNMLDGGMPFYDTYETADGRYVSVAALEPQFYLALLDVLGLDPAQWPQLDPSRWPDLRAELRRVFAGKTRDEWAALFEGVDACVAPVLTLAEAPDHPQLKARETFTEVDGVRQPGPAPRFSRTPGAIQTTPPTLGEHTDAVLAELGLSPESVAALRRRRVSA